MIVPKQAHSALLADVEAAQQQRGEFHLWWLGQSGFLVQWRGEHLLFDPYLSDSLTTKYAHTDKPHVRMSGLVIDSHKLDFVDVVTSSHNHTDHLDAATLKPLIQGNSDLHMIVPAANVEFAAERLEVPDQRLTGIDDGQTVTCGQFTLHAIPAAHETVERDSQGRCHFLGFVAEFGDSTIYHSGDTMLFAGIEERLSNWRVDVALLPINGRANERRVAGNLWGREAAQLAHNIGAKMVIPCHYDMFEFNTATPEEFIKHSEMLGQSYRVLELGERCSCPANGGSQS